MFFIFLDSRWPFCFNQIDVVFVNHLNNCKSDDKEDEVKKLICKYKNQILFVIPNSRMCDLPSNNFHFRVKLQRYKYESRILLGFNVSFGNTSPLTDFYLGISVSDLNV